MLDVLYQCIALVLCLGFGLVTDYGKVLWVTLLKTFLLSDSIVF